MQTRGSVTCSLVGLCCFLALDKSVGPEFIRQFLQTNLWKGFLGPGREDLLFILSVSLSIYFCLYVHVCVSLFVSVSMNVPLFPSVSAQLRAWGLVAFSSLALRAVGPWALA